MVDFDLATCSVVKLFIYPHFPDLPFLASSPVLFSVFVWVVLLAFVLFSNQSLVLLYFQYFEESYVSFLVSLDLNPKKFG